MSGEAKYKVILYNDAAIAVGTKVEGVAYAPFDGYLVGVGVAGAGIEDLEVFTSAGDPVQHIPGRDVAIDTDALANATPGSDRFFPGGLIAIFNQPIEKNTRIDINYRNGTGTAEANVYFIFSKTPLGPYRLWQGGEDTIAVGSVLQEAPTGVPGLTTLESVFIRGAAGQDLEIQLSDCGPLCQIVSRAIAVDTDAEPVGDFQPVMADIPSRIITNAFNGFTGVAMFYATYI